MDVSTVPDRRLARSQKAINLEEIMPIRGDAPLGVIDIDYNFISRAIDSLFDWRVEHLFAWLPVTTTSGRRIWFKKYVKRWRRIDGIYPQGDYPVESQIFTPPEYTYWLLANKN